jgi:cytochrome c-type biogenesis protein CcmH/NrfG
MSSRNSFAFILMACLLAAGIAATSFYLRSFAGSPGSEASISPSRSDDEMIERLSDYTRSIGIAEPASRAAAGTLQPDVRTMIERLAVRLETMPEDVKGWRMLGWSYLHTGHYKQAAAAYEKAVQLDPSSAETKVAYEDAKAKALGSDNPSGAGSLTGEAAGGLDEKIVNSEAMTTRERDVAIRAMVDGLAERLENSPRDADGWMRLIRSRLVLGQREIATAVFRKALEVFKDDPAASGRISAAATGLGLKVD